MPAEDMGKHDQGRPGTLLQTASLRLRTMEKISSELAQDRRVRGGGIRDVVNYTDEASPTLPE